MHGTFFTIHKPQTQELLWLAVLDEKTEHFWVYDHTTGNFHQKPGLRVDYIIDQELTYTPIDQNQAIKVSNTIQRNLPQGLQKQHAQDTTAIPAYLVFKI